MNTICTVGQVLSGLNLSHGKRSNLTVYLRYAFMSSHFTECLAHKSTHIVQGCSRVPLRSFIRRRWSRSVTPCIFCQCCLLSIISFRARCLVLSANVAIHKLASLVSILSGSWYSSRASLARGALYSIIRPVTIY